MSAPRFQMEDWQPSKKVTLAWSVLSVVLSISGIGLFAAIYAFSHGGSGGGRISLSSLVASTLICFLLLGLHERVHGLTMKVFGAPPEYGAGLYNSVLPYLYCTSPGHRFTRTQFAAISAAPLVLISVVGALWVAFVPLGGWLVLPLGVHLGGCIGDIWSLGVIARLPRGTVLEDLRTGVRIVRTAV